MRVFLRHLLAALLLLLTCDVGLGQFGKAKTPAATSPLAIEVLDGIDNPIVAAELKLAEDQLGPLLAHRQARWDLRFSGDRLDVARGERAWEKETDDLMR